MRNSNFALRLQGSLLDEARKIAEQEGVALNQFINVAVAEKLSAIRTATFFAERRARVDVAEALAILAKAGRGNPPVPGDELPPDWKPKGMAEDHARYIAPKGTQKERKVKKRKVKP